MVQLQKPEGSDFDRSDQKTTVRSRRLPAWTGLNDRTLWDILLFLGTAAVPVVLGIFSFQQSQADALREINAQSRIEQTQRNQVMTSYIDAMTNFLKEQSQEKVKDKATAQMIVRARTLNVLRQLDSDREDNGEIQKSSLMGFFSNQGDNRKNYEDGGVLKGQVLRFLYETNLVRRCHNTSEATSEAETFAGCTSLLSGARLDDLALESPIPLPGIDLTGAMLPGAKLQSIDLTEAQLEKANFTGADLSGAFLKGARMQNILLEDAVVKGTDLQGADLTDAFARRANLDGANLSKATLTNAYLVEANLSNANLQDADLRSADLSGAIFNNTSLNGARYNKVTKFPAGFDAAARGMRKE
jgi:uncharacterized protein YjbI with pentapeptide repeats